MKTKSILRISATFILMLSPISMSAQARPNEKGPATLANSFQGTWNTDEFSHGRCNPSIGSPQANFFWSPSGLNYVDAVWSGYSGGGLTLIPLSSPEAAPRQSFDRNKAVGKPYYMSITKKDGTIGELTALDCTAALRFTYPGKGKKSQYVLLQGIGQDADVKGRTITGQAMGWRRSKTYYIVNFDRDFNAERRGRDLLLTFAPSTQPVNVTVAESRISPEQASLNYKREAEGKTFDDIRATSLSQWNDALGRIEIEGGTLEQRKTFYSCMYHTYLRPSRYYETDANGKDHYAWDDVVYDGKYHSNPILWDAYRCLFSLHNIINPSIQKDYVKSLVRTKELTGSWPSGHIMIGNHAISVLADAWAKGIRTFDPKVALDYYYDEITYAWVDTVEDRDYNIEHIRGNGRLGFEEYFTKGYISFPQDTKRVIESTSKTIEYNYDDFCAYKLAQMTGNRFWEDIFAKHIYNYCNVFDPSDSFFKGRDASGRFDEDFNPYEWGGPLVEGNAWQWRFAVQQDAAGMMDLMGGEQAFIDNLDEVFAAPADSSLNLWGGYGFRIHEITEAAAGGQGQYAQANEPCFHVIHLYSHAGQPWKGQPKLRDSLQRLFDSSAKGFPGDEDGGAMSAWYIFNCMGFYPVTPGVAEYTFGSPLFNKITIHLEDGKDFVIEAEGNSPKNVYISSVKLNGKDYSPSFLTHEDVMKGGKLTFTMSNVPAKERGKALSDRPYSLSRDAQAVKNSKVTINH